MKAVPEDYEDDDEDDDEGRFYADVDSERGDDSDEDDEDDKDGDDEVDYEVLRKEVRKPELPSVSSSNCDAL